MKPILLALAATFAFVALPLAAHTDGAFFPSNREWRQRRERSLINEPDQKALIVFRNGLEDLIISPSYQGDIHDFAWVVPVPDRPKVQVLTGAPFHELARLVEPEPPRRYPSRTSMEAKGAMGGVRVLERKTVGDYDVSVLAATDARALTKWLARNDYHLPDRAEEPIRAYVREGWTFVASRIKTPRLQTSEGLQSGTLSPLRLTFAATRPVYPMRLSSVNPAPFRTLVYVALPRLGDSYLEWVKGAEGTRQRFRHTSLPEGSRYAYPTLSKLSASGLEVFWSQQTVTPKQCSQDWVWNGPSRTPIRK